MNKHDKFKDLVKWANNAYDKAPVTVTDSKLNPEERAHIWKEKLKVPADIFDFLNPYYLGFGNPLSDILIIGKELGFDISETATESETEQVINESLENAFHWKHLLDGNEVNIDKFKSPRKPYGGIQDDFKPGHTWRLYQKFIINLGIEIPEKDSFLDHCFLTEFNFAPSKYSPGGLVLDPRRKELLKKEYFKTFSKILLTYRSYDKKKENQGLTEKLFDVNFIESKKVGKQVYLLYKSEAEDRTVVLTNQLSGSAGWSDEELKHLAQLFK